MNNVRLRDFSIETLEQISDLIDTDTSVIRHVYRRFEMPEKVQRELSNMLEFQTQVEYAKFLIQEEQKTISN